MDWDHAIKRNSEVLAGIVETLFVMLGLVGEATVSRISWPAYRAVLRVLRSCRIRPAAAHCGCGTGLCRGEARSVPSQEGGGSKSKEGRNLTCSLLPALRSAATHHAAAPQDVQAGCPAHPLFQYRWRVYNHWAAGAAGKSFRPDQIR